MYSDRRDAGRQLAPPRTPEGSRDRGPRAATRRGARRRRGRHRPRGAARRDPGPQARCPVPAEVGLGRDRRGRGAGDQPRRAADGPRQRAGDGLGGAARARLPRAPGPAVPAGRPPRPLAGSTAVVVDDGLATGATAMAACEVARARRDPRGARGAGRATGVSGGSTTGSTRWCARGSRRASPRSASSTATSGRSPTRRSWTCWRGPRRPSRTDAGGRLRAASTAPVHVGPSDEEVRIPAAGVELPGRLTIPDGARRGAVRARQRQQPAQPAQPVRRRRAAPGRAGHAAVRPAHRP